MIEFVNAHPLILCLAIFLARIADVSLGTIRTIMVIRGYRTLSAVIGFFEVTIWIIAAGQVLKNLNEWHLAFSYAAGFAAGNIVGIWLESKLAFGSELVRAISKNPETNLAHHLRMSGFEVTEVPGEGGDSSPVEILLIVEKRSRIPGLLRIIEEYDPDAIYTISDVKAHRSAPVSSEKPCSEKSDSIRKGKRK